MLGDYDNFDEPSSKLKFLVIPIFLPCFIGWVIWHQLNPEPPLKNDYAFGCYSAESAPSIKLDHDGMHVVQKNFPTIPFHLERHKTGIAISADQPIQANIINGSYVYSFFHPGIGYYLDFYRKDNSDRIGVFDETELSSFTMLTRNDSYISYTPAPSSACLSK